MTTPANTLTPGQTAGIVLSSDPTTGISAADYSATSADEAIASIVDPGSNTLGVHYEAPGSVDITVTRLVDGTARVHSVTCIAPLPPPADWDWELGTAV